MIGRARRNEDGVTLIELAVVLMLMSIVAIILFGFLSSVLRVSTRATNNSETEKAIDARVAAGDREHPRRVERRDGVPGDGVVHGGRQLSDRLHELPAGDRAPTDGGATLVPQERLHLRPQGRRHPSRGSHRLRARRRQLRRQRRRYTGRQLLQQRRERSQPLFTYFDRFGNQLDPAARRSDDRPLHRRGHRPGDVERAVPDRKPVAVVHQRPSAEEQPMSRLHRSPATNSGSIIIALMVIFVATGFIVGVVALVYNSMKVTRRSGDSANALQLADAAVNDAVKDIPGVVGSNMPTKTKTLGTAGSYTYSATLDPAAPIWHIDAYGIDNSGRETPRAGRSVAREPVQQRVLRRLRRSRCRPACLMDSFTNGSSLQTTCTRKGILGTNNPGSLSFQSNGGNGNGQQNCTDAVWYGASNIWAYPGRRMRRLPRPERSPTCARRNTARPTIAPRFRTPRSRRRSSRSRASPFQPVRRS